MGRYYVNKCLGLFRLDMNMLVVNFQISGKGDTLSLLL